MQDAILIVEDDESVADVLSLVLDPLGPSIEHVDNGTAAVERIGAGGLALVVLDLGLPDLDGMEVCRRVRASGFAGPILALSARYGEDVARQVTEAGATDFMRKPFVVAELRSCARALLV